MGERWVKVSPHLTSPKIFWKSAFTLFHPWVNLGEDFSPHLTSPKIFKKTFSPKFTLRVSLGEKFSPHPWVKVKGWICIPVLEYLRTSIVIFGLLWTFLDINGHLINTCGNLEILRDLTNLCRFMDIWGHSIFFWTFVDIADICEWSWCFKRFFPYLWHFLKYKDICTHVKCLNVKNKLSNVIESQN